MTDRPPITERQHKVLQFVQEYRRSKGISPTLEEIARHLRVHRVTVFGHIRELVRKDYLRKTARVSRSLDPVEGAAAAAPSLRIPLAGRVVAGSPVEAIEDRADIAADELLRARPGAFLLEVTGDSMIEDGILPRDLVLVESRRDAANGDVVVAVLDSGEATLKRFFREADGSIRLQPANATYAPIVVRDVEIRGVVVGLVRRYDRPRLP